MKNRFFKITLIFISFTLLLACKKDKEKNPDPLNFEATSWEWKGYLNDGITFSYRLDFEKDSVVKYSIYKGAGKLDMSVRCRYDIMIVSERKLIKIYGENTVLTYDILLAYGPSTSLSQQTLSIMNSTPRIIYNRIQ